MSMKKQTTCVSVKRINHKEEKKKTKFQEDQKKKIS